MPPARPRRPAHHHDDDLHLPPLDGDDSDALPREDDGAVELPVETASFDDELDDTALLTEDLVDTDEATWVDDAGDADDLDVGDLSDEIDDGGDGWVGDERDPDAPGDGDGDLDDAVSDVRDDRGEEGPEHDDLDVIDEGGPLEDDLADAENDADLDDGQSDVAAAEAPELPAFALVPPSWPAHARLLTDGAVLAAAVGTTGVVLAGDGVFAAKRTALEPSGVRTVSVKRVAAPADELLTSIVFVGARALVAASIEGRVLRSEDGGARWEAIAALGGHDAGKAAVELSVEPTSGGARLWARAHGGGLFRSDDGGRTWEGPTLPQPVRALAVDARGGGVLAATSGWVPEVLRSTDGHAWQAMPIKLPGPPVLLACCGDVVVFAFARGAALVSVDGGATLVPWPVLAGATALTLVDTDDGVVQVVAAVYDEASDHATLFAAAIGSDGAPRGAHRLADVDALLPGSTEAPGDETEARVEALASLDATGRRLLAITPRGVVVVARE